MLVDKETQKETQNVASATTEAAAPTTKIVADKKVENKDAKPAEKKPNGPQRRPGGPGAGGSRPGGQRPGGGSRPGGPRTGGPRRNGPRRNNRRGRDTEFEEKVIDIARVTTVVKGGRRFSFSALVVVGNKKGKIGWGHGKANEVPDSIKKAIKDAKNNMIVAPIIDKRTVPHDQVGNFLSSSVLVKPAPKGKGVIASGSIRAVVELAGYKDIYTKSLGSRSKTNSVKATIVALKQLRTIEEIAKLRDVEVSDILG